MFKNILTYLPIISLGVALIAGWTRLNAASDNTKEAIKDIKTEIKEITIDGNKEINDLKKENAELDKAVVAQTVKLENIQQILEKIDKKLEKK